MLVTGATGFLGRHVIDACVDRGCLVRALVRSTSSAVPPAVEPVVCADLTDRPAVRRGMAGVDTVVHMAARAHVTDERSEASLAAFRRSNVDGTCVLLEEALRAGVRRFLYVSSVGAVRQQSETVVTEGTEPDPTTAYGRSKLEAEDAMHRLAAGTSLHGVILRPPMIYGAGMRGNPARLFKLVDRGIPLPFASVTNRRSALYVGNFAAAVIAALRAVQPGVRTFLVGDDGEFSTPELIRKIARVLGRPNRLFPVPVEVLRAGGRLGDVLARAVPMPFTSRALGSLTDSLVLSGAALRAYTGFVPPYTPDEGLQATAAWYQGARSGS